MNGLRVAIVTFGCKVNTYDSATIGERLEAAGCAVVDDAAGADVVVVNSCTVTDAAAAETRGLVRRLGRRNARVRVVVTGCHAQTSAAALATLPEVDHVVGIGRLDQLVDAVTGPASLAPRVDVYPSRDHRPFGTFGARRFPGRTRAFLKVQEGCDLFCTFCVVPWARGRSRSLPPSQVLAEFDRLAAGGHEEIVLTAVHLGGYGLDLQPRVELVDLLGMLAERANGPRVRLTSLDPHELSDRLLACVAGGAAICEHLHVPLQAGDDATLRRMRRPYDTAIARDRLARARELLPEASIGTDLIAGFPGEDDAAFERTFRFVETSPITYAHVFPYSPRQGTTAAKLAGLPPVALRRDRAARLRRLCLRKTREFRTGFDGTQAEVLVERRRDPRSGRLTGYTRNYLRVVFDGPDGLAGRRVSLRLLVSADGTVEGRIAA